MILASLMFLLPILFYLISPQSAGKDLEKIDNWLNKAMPYVVVGILFIIGLLLILDGTKGVINHLAS